MTIHIKRIFLPLLVLTLSLRCHAEMKQALTLYMYAGDCVVYYLEQQPVINFAGQQMVVATAAGRDEIPMDGVDRWEVGMAEYSGMALAETTKATICVNGTSVRVYNPSGQNIGIYNISGVCEAMSTSEEAEFSLDRGIHVITIGNKSYKIAIR